MATEAHEVGAAFAAGASPELTKTNSSGNERARDLEDRARREHNNNLRDARSEWEKRSGSKLTDEKQQKAVDGNLGFDAKRDAAGRRERTGDAALDKRIKTAEDILSVAQKISELKDFSEYGSDLAKLKIEDIIFSQYDRIPQLKPIADLIKGNGVPAIPASEKMKLIQHLLDKQPDFAKHMMDRLKPLLESSAVPDYGLGDLKKQEAAQKQKDLDLDDELIRLAAQKDARIAGSTDRSHSPNKDAELNDAQKFIDSQKKADPKLFKDVDAYIKLRNERDYLQKKVAATTDAAEKSKFLAEITKTDAQFTTLAGKVEIRDALTTPAPGSPAENVKNYIISQDTIDLTKGEDRRARGIPTEKTAIANELARLATEMAPKQAQRDKDEIEYVKKLRNAIGESAFDTMVSRMDKNMDAISADIKRTARNELGQTLNDELRRRGFFGETADRRQIREYFNDLVLNGENAAIERLGLAEELRQEITNNPDLRAEFNQAILYNAMKYNGLRREDIENISNFEWGSAAIDGAIKKNEQINKWEKDMQKNGLLAGGMVEWLRKHPNKNIVAAIITALLTGVGAATVIGLASIPAAGLVGAAAVVGGIKGGNFARNLGEAA